jgi:hypothetical protein
MSSSGAGSQTCFQSMEILLKVAMEPIDSLHPTNAVKKQLSNILFKFNDVLEGIPLSFTELKFPPGKEYGRILGSEPWIHVDVITKVSIFKPIVGVKVRGKIVAVSDNHVSILVFAMFNASISGAEMKKGYKYSSLSKAWSSPRVDLSVDDYIVFTIASFQHSSGVVNIEGSI